MMSRAAFTCMVAVWYVALLTTGHLAPNASVTRLSSNPFVSRRSGAVPSSPVRLPAWRAHSASCPTPWRVVATPAVAGSGSLRSAVALSSSNVWAVGSVEDGGGEDTLIEHWDGARWRTVASPDNGGPVTRLFGIGARSATDIWAVGDYKNADAAGTLTEHWDGTHWRIVPDAGAGTGILLNAVAVIAHDDVWAVGSGRGGLGTGTTLTEHWDGARWTIVPSPGRSRFSIGLTAVAAVSRTDVWAVGSYQNSVGTWPLVEHWDGVHWRIVTMPDTSMGTLSGITAVSAHDVWVVGATSDYLAAQPLMEHWDGAHWQVVASPRPAGAGGYTLAAVTASAPDDVWTVGSAGADGPSLIEHWDGRRWRVMPSPPGSLLSITASSAGHVWATGVQAGDAGAPYVVHYTGMPCYAVVPIVRTISAGRYPFALADDQIARRLFVRDDDGTVDVIDTSSGSVVRKTPVGRYDYGDYLAASSWQIRGISRVTAT